MAQYYIVANLDKQEFLRPHFMGDGSKLMEFTCSSLGTMTGLGVLLATSSGKGSGDLSNVPEGNAIVGRWAGDRIAIIGDYDDKPENKKIYDDAAAHANGWLDISFPVMETLFNDGTIRSEVVKNNFYRDIWNQNHPQKRPFPTK